MHAYIAAWRERRVIAAFAESLAAYGVLYGFGIAALLVGAYCVEKTPPFQGMHWPRYVAGFVTGLVVFSLGVFVGKSIPGVGGRVDQILDGEDYDDHIHW